MAAGIAYLNPSPKGELFCPLCGSKLVFDALGGWLCYGKNPNREHPHCEKRDYYNEMFGDPEKVQGQTFGCYIVNGEKIAECWAVRNRGPYWHVRLSPYDFAFPDYEMPERLKGGEWVILLK